ncbi:hypothetical protein BVX97_01415 [bacterium E08(2017)]|nr:hypothetical protein BVX97_01415 [bacterium E08(2017)]
MNDTRLWWKKQPRRKLVASRRYGKTWNDGKLFQESARSLSVSMRARVMNNTTGNNNGSHLFIE